MRLIIFVLVGVASLIPSARAATLSATPVNLAVQLAKAKPGDTLTLEPGEYDVLSLSTRTFSTPVTITGPGAVLKGLKLDAVEGLNLVGLEFAAACGGGLNPLIAIDSKNLHFESLVIHGDNDCWSGLLIRRSSNVVVTKSTFRNLGTGLNHLSSRDLRFEGNTFHDIQSDGIRGGCTSRLLVKDNVLTDFYPAPGDHPDAIQNWTTGCDSVTSDLTFTGNVYVRGKGAVAQGIFVMRDAEGDRRYARVKVTDNVILGGMYNGITVQGVDGGEVSGNIVAGFPDMASWIRAQDNTALMITGNRSQNYIYPGGKAGISERGNKTLSPITDGGAKILGGMPPKAGRVLPIVGSQR